MGEPRAGQGGPGGPGGPGGEPGGHGGPGGPGGPGGSDGIRKLVLPLAVAVIIFVTLLVVTILGLQSKVNAFCESTFDTRRLFALILTSVSTDESDTLADDARQRVQADRIEPLLMDLPDQCDGQVNVEELRIRVNGDLRDVAWP